MNTRVLTATLPSDALYVSGTVNGVATTWTNTEGQTWETVAERSENDVYAVALEMVGTGGAVTKVTFTLYYGLHLITDRTYADVANGTEKGCYNASDLNRVNAAMDYVAGRLIEYGYAPSVQTKSNWMDTDWMTESTAQQYLENLSELRRQFALLQPTPPVPDDMQGLTYTETNNIDKILEDIDFLLTNISKTWVYSGEVYSGEV